MEREKLVSYLDELLKVSEFSDYGPNGLQIEGCQDIQKIAFAVSATVDSIKEACEWGADALIVHHGLFWKFHGPKTITGVFAKRVKPLIQNDISLLGYHLPLDAHMEFGNAVSIANQINLTGLKPFGDFKGSPTGVKGKLKTPLKPTALAKALKGVLGHEIIHSCPNEEDIKTLGIITGGANNDWETALNEELDAFLTGEISEYNWHDAKEAGIHFFAGGHHATERFGVLALKEHLEKKFSLECKFFDSQNPA